MPVTRSLAAALVSEDADELRQVHHDSVSISGSLSSRKSVDSSARSRVLVAELKQKLLLEELKLEKREIELKHERDLMSARKEIELAKLDALLEEQGELATAEVMSADKETLIKTFVEDCQRNTFQRTMGEVDVPSSPHEKFPVVNTISSSMELFSRGFELPRVELSYFDGNPVEYLKFMKQFEHYVESKVSDDGQRLLYLLYYCKGRAKDLIHECVMLSPSIGYRRARKLLHDRFGQTHYVARALLDKLLNHSKSISNNAEALNDLAVRMENCSIALTEMNYTADLNALHTLETIVRALPEPMQYKWAEFVDKVTVSGREPSFSDLLEFVSSRARVSRSRFGLLAENSRQTSRAHQAKQPEKIEVSRRSVFSNQLPKTLSDVGSCPVCEGNHYLNDCIEFRKLNIAERWEVVKNNKACFSCLKLNHRARDCRVQKRCSVNDCQATHHSLLHTDSRITSHGSSSPRLANCAAVNSIPRRVSLGIVPVRVVGPTREILTYALLDSGSDTTLVSRELIKRLQIACEPSSLTINTVTGSKRIEGQSVSLHIRSLDCTEEVQIERAFSVSHLPIKPLVGSIQHETNKWPHLASIQFDEIDEKVVGLLIGNDVPEAHWTLDQRLGKRKQPFAVKTLLGWMLLGPLGPGERAMTNANCVQRVGPSIAEQVQRLYNAEFADTDKVSESPSVDDLNALHLVQNSTQLVNGHYVVPIPWRDPDRVVPDNRLTAERRLDCLKRRFVRDPEYFKRYCNVMEQGFLKGHAIRVPISQLTPEFTPRWYLPHHGVVNPKKPDKLRVVLDCAAQCRGISLNDQLLQGPDVITGLVPVLMRFRKYPIALAADVEEMFMQVMVPERDRSALRFFWWPDNNLSANPVEYQMVAHPFGATSSPFCASFALQKTATDFGHEFESNIADAVRNNFYVDDCLISFNYIEEAKRFVPQICELLAKGGFRLRKWVSNRNDVLGCIPDTERVLPEKEIAISTKTSERMLGLEWDAKSDRFRFQFRLQDGPLTRRGILSSVSSVFDPLGLVSPLILPAKLLLQKLCKIGLGWDDPISQIDSMVWKQWFTYMINLEPIEVPRCITGEGDEGNDAAQLHLFCDASETGYGAVAYARFVPKSNQPYCTLLFAKSRVAPIKTVTIPRLELNAAVLAVRIEKIVSEGLRMKFESVTYWTDSAIVLHYINNTSTRFKTFVANRISFIRDGSSPKQWHHVRSEHNPADLASRGIRNPKDWDAWQKGPEFLFAIDGFEHDEYLELPPIIETELEPQYASINATSCTYPVSPLLCYFSCWFKLLRAIAWLTRFKRWIIERHHAGTRNSQRLGPILVSELDKARGDVIRMVQHEVYPLVSGRLHKTGSPLNNDGMTTVRLRKLCPIIINGLLCVGGRLGYTNYSEDVKHPAILPNKHPVVDSIIRSLHSIEGHSGPSHVLGTLRKRFWIVGGMKAVRRVIGNCVPCMKRQARPCEQQMAPLPAARAETGWFPFEHVGVDYFGPMLVKRGRGAEKRFGCLFTCLKTRAVHLEVASDLSTDSFINVLIRFVGRRGCPSDLYSDNGTNFVGTVKELRSIIQGWNTLKIHEQLLKRGIQWHFNPPACSHRGGVWERMIRSTRRILQNICGTQMLTDDSLTTLFVEVERILNNRPLCPPSSDSQDAPPLSPSDLLLVKGSPFEQPEASIKEIYTKRWRQVNQLATSFWRRWLREYMLVLQARQKWIVPRNELRSGDLVLVAMDDLPRGEWPLGRVIDAEPSQDGLIRTVSIKTTKGVVRRDVRRICRLEGDG